LLGLVRGALEEEHFAALAVGVLAEVHDVKRVVQHFGLRILLHGLHVGPTLLVRTRETHDESIVVFDLLLAVGVEFVLPHDHDVVADDLGVFKGDFGHVKADVPLVLEQFGHFLAVVRQLLQVHFLVEAFVGRAED